MSKLVHDERESRFSIRARGVDLDHVVERMREAVEPVHRRAVRDPPILTVERDASGGEGNRVPTLRGRVECRDVIAAERRIDREVERVPRASEQREHNQCGACAGGTR